MYANPYQMMNHPPLNNPQIYQYNNLPAFNYPLSYSQVTPPTNQYNQVGLIEQQKN
jgi:hypothetical protein